MGRGFALVVCIAAVGCQKSAPPAPQAPLAPPAKRGPPPAEVELNVEVTSDVADAAKTVLFVTPQPCDAEGAAKAKFGAVPAKTTGGTFIEVFVPQGTKGYVCAAALDASGQLVGLGGSPQNPFPFAGEGEVTFKPAVRVAKLPAPRPAPEGLASSN